MDGQRKLIRLLAAVAILAAGAAARAEPDWNRVDDPLQGGIGLHAGKIGGTGLAFKWPLRWFLQAQLAGGIWNTADDKRHNLGVGLQYLLRQDPRLRLFLLTGYGTTYHKEKQRLETGEEVWSTDTTWNAGFGGGIAYLLGDRWAVQVDADFTYRDEHDSVTLWPQAGLFFYW